MPAGGRPEQLSAFADFASKAQSFRLAKENSWIAIKERKLSCYDKETL